MIVPAQPVVAGRERPGHAVARGSVDELRARGGGRVAIDPHAPGVEADHRFLQIAQDGQRRPRIDLQPEPAVTVHDRGPEGCSARVACEIRSLKSSATVGAPECADAVPGNARKPPMTINTRAGIPAPRPRDRWVQRFSSRPHPAVGVHMGLGRRKRVVRAAPRAVRAAGSAASRAEPCSRRVPRSDARAGDASRRAGRERPAGPVAQEGERGRTRRHDHQDREPPPSATDTSEREWAATLCSIVSCTSRNASPDMANRIADWSKERPARSHGSRKSRWRSPKRTRPTRPTTAASDSPAIPACTSSGSRGLRRLGELSGRARCARPARRRRRPGSARARR